MKNGYADLREQSRLYFEHVAPHETAFIRFLEEKRDEVDAVFEERKREAIEAWTSERGRGEQDILRYPEGYCLEIVTKVRGKVEENMPDYLAKFVAEGGCFEKCWGILDTPHQGRVFQNVFHIGTKIFDVAHGETSPNETRKIAAYPLNSPKYRNFKSLEEYADVRSSYQNAEAYSTYGIFGGTMAFAVPAVFVHGDGWTGIMDEATTTAINIRSNFRAAKDFLRDSKYARKSLPEEAVRRIRLCMGWIVNESVVYEDEYFNHVSMLVKMVAHGFEKDVRAFSHAELRRASKNWNVILDRYGKRATELGIPANEVAGHIVANVQTAFEAAFALYNGLRHDEFREAFHDEGCRWALIPFATRNGIENGAFRLVGK